MFFVITNLSFFPIFHKSCSEMLKIVLERLKMSEISGGFAPSTPTGACSPWTLLAGALPPTPPPGLRPWTPLVGGFTPHAP